MESITTIEYLTARASSSNEEGEKALKAYEEEKHPKNVLFGHGWKPTQWKQKDGEQMLEEAFPDKPVILFAEDRGSCIMNEKAKEVYQFTSDSCYPESYYRIMKEYLNEIRCQKRTDWRARASASVWEMRKWSAI